MASEVEDSTIENPNEANEVIDEIEEIVDEGTEMTTRIIDLETEDSQDDEEPPSTERPEQSKQLSLFSEDKIEVSEKTVPDADMKNLIESQEEDDEIITMKPIDIVNNNSSKLPTTLDIIEQDLRLEEPQTNKIVQAEGRENINLEDEDHSIVSSDEAFVNEILEDSNDKNDEPAIDTTEQYIEITTIFP